MKFKEEVVEISERAFKEYKIEEQLDELEKRWDRVIFELTKFRNQIII